MHYHEMSLSNIFAHYENTVLVFCMKRLTPKLWSSSKTIVAKCVCTTNLLRDCFLFFRTDCTGVLSKLLLTLIIILLMWSD